MTECWGCASGFEDEELTFLTNIGVYCNCCMDDFYS